MIPYPGACSSTVAYSRAPAIFGWKDPRPTSSAPPPLDGETAASWITRCTHLPPGAYARVVKRRPADVPDLTEQAGRASRARPWRIVVRDLATYPKTLALTAARTAVADRRQLVAGQHFTDTPADVVSRYQAPATSAAPNSSPDAWPDGHAPNLAMAPQHQRGQEGRAPARPPLSGSTAHDSPEIVSLAIIGHDQGERCPLPEALIDIPVPALWTSPPRQTGKGEP
ncbi:hypothetical protein GCM10010300_82520 [Streptomyces olivaceoviridis]|nr:hypothetical protein GCM10010300_82520 [Streptomyces olivaceoviridis]